jgi:hypothetical protein
MLLATLCASAPAFAQHAGHVPPAGMAMGQGAPREPGQAAFSAIQEIVAILEKDPATDWSKVDLERLRLHLVDMDNVTMRARATPEPVEHGVRFVVTGEGDTAASIRRMVLAHAATMNGVQGWRMEAEERPEGAALTVRAADPRDVGKIRALGFIGVMARGMHHQSHHLALARGMNPHQ